MQHNQALPTFPGRFRRLLDRVRGPWRRKANAPAQPAELAVDIRGLIASNDEAATAARPRTLALALQGGGAHGAFTWGVLDRLLEEPGLEIPAISGSSAGALNAAALAAGHLEGGADGARRRLAELWQGVADLARSSPLRAASGWSPSQLFFDFATRFFSPYQMNPLGHNPLRDLLDPLIDFERLKAREAIRLFVAATNVETGAARIFTNAEITLDVMLASACLPTLHQAVKLDDGYYWDGGFTANPPLLPLVEASEASDLLLVRLDPSHEGGLPRTSQAIADRLNHIVIGAPLKAELGAVAALQRMAAEAGVAPGPVGRRMAALRLHSVGDDALMRKLGPRSRLVPDRKLVQELHAAGRRSAGQWLADGSFLDGKADLPRRQALPSN